MPGLCLFYVLALLKGTYEKKINLLKYETSVIFQTALIELEIMKHIRFLPMYSLYILDHILLMCEKHFSNKCVQWFQKLPSQASESNEICSFYIKSSRLWLQSTNDEYIKPLIFFHYFQTLFHSKHSRYLCVNFCHIFYCS